MKKSLLTFCIILTGIFGYAQVDTISIYDLQHVDQATLQNCVDTSLYQNKQVHFIGVVAVDGGLSEISSGSITGGNRPFINVVDTVSGPFLGVDVMGVIDGTTDPYPGFENLVAGDVISITGSVGAFDGETQVTPASSTAITVLGSIAAPTPVVVSVGDLNDDQRTNILETGEQWEGSYVELQNVTVVAVNYFSGGSRVSLDVVDASGNLINVSDRFLAQRMSSWQTVNPASPASTGNFVPPPVGTQYNHIRGFIIHSENGCTGNTGRGYEINPAWDSDYDIGVAPPNFANITKSIAVPTSSDQVTISATISDFDGTVTSAELLYSTNLSDPISSFTSVAMTNTSGDDYEATIPSNADGTVVRYILQATDNASNTTVTPFTPSSQTTPNVYHYTVRDNGLQIVDIQKTFGGSDLSALVGEEVEFTGIVTASAKNFDIGYIYVQQEDASEYAGINCVGNPDLISLCRNEEVTIKGIVEESFGFTRVGVTQVTKTGGVKKLAPTMVDPSDPNLNHEAYESMLIQAENPGGGQLFVNNADAGFGEYEIGTTMGGTDNIRILAGRQSSSSFSSLYVSLVTDSFYYANDGQMEVDVVLTDANMTLDSIAGLYYYSFGNYKLLPRNNDDIMGLSTALEASGFVDCAQDTTSVQENMMQHEFQIFPNPTNGQLNIQILGGEKEVYEVSIKDLTGKEVFRKVSLYAIENLDVSYLSKGVYLIDLLSKNGMRLNTQKFIIE